VLIALNIPDPHERVVLAKAESIRIVVQHAQVNGGQHRVAGFHGERQVLIGMSSADPLHVRDSREHIVETL
jgi:hypothetical protein